MKIQFQTFGILVPRARARSLALFLLSLLLVIFWIQPGVAEAKTRLGLLLPLSGKHKRLGQAALEAVTFAQTSQSDLEIVLGDTKGTAKGARAQMERLAADPSILAVLGPIGWEESRAAAEVAQRVGITLISLSAEEGIEDIGSFVFRGRPSIEAQARLMAEVAIKELDFERVAILHPDDVLGRNAARTFFEAARRGGLKVTALVSYKSGETNLQKPVEELVAKRSYKLRGKSLRGPPRGHMRASGRKSQVDFQAIFIPDYDDTVSLATKFLRYHDVPLSGLSDGVPVQILGTSHMRGPRLADSGGLINGALYPEIFESSRGNATGAFKEAFVEACGRDPAGLDAQVFDLVTIILDHAKGLGMTNDPVKRRQRLVDGLVNMEPFEGLTGKQSFERDGTPRREFQIWVVNASGDVAPSF